jgi:hypothetical protein
MFPSVIYACEMLFMLLDASQKICNIRTGIIQFVDLAIVKKAFWMACKFVNMYI